MLAGGNFLSLVGPFLDGAVLRAVLNDAYFLAASTNCRPSNVVTKQLLHIRVLPAWQANRHELCQWLGVAIEMASTSLLSNTFAVLNAIRGVLELLRQFLDHRKGWVGVDQV